jgi:hypothetical protein
MQEVSQAGDPQTAGGSSSSGAASGGMKPLILEEIEATQGVSREGDSHDSGRSSSPGSAVGDRRERILDTIAMVCDSNDFGSNNIFGNPPVAQIARADIRGKSYGPSDSHASGSSSILVNHFGSSQMEHMVQMTLPMMKLAKGLADGRGKTYGPIDSHASGRSSRRPGPWAGRLRRLIGFCSGGNVATSKSRKIKIVTPTGTEVILEVTAETGARWVRYELSKSVNIKPWNMSLIWKGDVLDWDDDLSKVILETTTGAAVLHLIGGTQIFVTGPRGPRTFVIYVEDDDTMGDVARQVQAILGGSGYLLKQFERYLDVEKTVAHYKLKSYDLLVCEDYYDPSPAWIPSICSASSAIGRTLAGTRVEECGSADGDEQRDDEQIKIHTPTGNNFMVFATETRKENDHRSKKLIWKVHETGPPHTEPLDDMAGTLAMMNVIDKDMLGVRTLILIVKADDTIQDVIKQIQAMLSHGLDYLLTHCEKSLNEASTLADCQIKSCDVLVFTECLITDTYW